MSDPVFVFEFPEIEFTLGDLWPDGDAPVNPSIEDVLALIKKEGGAHRILSAWEIDDALVRSMTITRFPEWEGPEPVAVREPPPQEEALFDA